MKLPPLETEWGPKLAMSFARPRILIVALPTSGILHDEPVKLEASLTQQEVDALRVLLLRAGYPPGLITVTRLCRFIWFRQVDSPWNPPDRRTLVDATGRLFGLYHLVTNTLN